MTKEQLMRIKNNLQGNLTPEPIHLLVDALEQAWKDRDAAIANSVRLVPDSTGIVMVSTSVIDDLRGQRDQWKTSWEAAQKKITALTTERDAWMETATQSQRGSDYYSGLLDKIGELFGEPAYIADDGTRSDSILRAKVPELVLALSKERDELTDRLHKEVIMLNASEAVYGFAAWLTTREERVVLSAMDDAAPVCALVKRFCEINNLPEITEQWPNHLIHPPESSTHE
jgi:hypothetical protein